LQDFLQKQTKLLSFRKVTFLKMAKKNVLILVFTDLRHDARVMRQVKFLCKKFNVTVCCLDIPPSDDYKAIFLPKVRRNILSKTISALLLLTRSHHRALDKLYPYSDFLYNSFKDQVFDVIIANDIETLPFAFKLKRNSAKIIFDAHEYAPLHFEDRLAWRIFFKPFNTFLCRYYIPKVDAMMTIGEGLATAYESNFGVKPLVITNATSYYEASPTNTGLPTIRLVHHGIVTRSRKIELIIEMIDHLPEYFTLDLMLVVPGGSAKQAPYLEELKMFAASRKRVNFRPAVQSHEINGVLNEYDMGIILAPPINFNYSNGLPNKLYDYIQARLGVITGPTPEIAKIVRQFDIGVVADGFTSKEMAESVASIARTDVNRFKNNSDKIAPELSARSNESKLVKMVEDLTS
jgi:hypothetical protein